MFIFMPPGMMMSPGLLVGLAGAEPLGLDGGDVESPFMPAGPPSLVRRRS